MTKGIKLLQRFKFKEDGGDGDDGGNADGNGNTNDDQNKPNDDQGKGGNKPTDREAELLREVMDKKGKITSLADEVNALKANLTKFDGIDLDQVQALLTEKTDRERRELEKRGEFDRVKEQMVAEHGTVVESLKTSYEGKVGELSTELSKATSLITELTIGRSFGDSPYVRDTLTLTPSKARVVYGSHFELQDGKVVAFDKPAGASERTVLVDGSGQPLAFDQAIEKIVKADPDHEHLVRFKGKPGAGSKSDSDTKPKVRVGSGRDRIGAAIASGALKR